MQSTAQDGFAQIIVFWHFDKDLNEASQDIRDAISKIRDELPPEMEEPVLSRFDPGEMPIVSVILSSPTPRRLRAHPPSPTPRWSSSCAPSPASPTCACRARSSAR